MSSRAVSFVIAASVLMASGIVCHVLAKDTAELDEAAARVADVPLNFADWRGLEETSDEASFLMTGANGYWTRTYVHEYRKDAVHVILMCGRPGRMAIHTPEVCYRGAGYELREEPSVVGIKEIPGSQWWTGMFLKQASNPTRLQLFWAWNSRGDWEAATAPRWQYRGEPYLFKLYVSRDVGSQAGKDLRSELTHDFLRDFVPVLKQSLFPNVP